MLIGVDQGYTFTKNSKGNIFPSRVRQGKAMDLNNNILQININGIDYVIGEKDSSYSVDTNKISNENTKVCILTSIAMATREEYSEVQLITGLPPGHYNKQKEQLRQMLLSNDTTKINLRGQKKVIKIKRADIFVQGAGQVFINPMRFQNCKTLTIDIGGLTVDSCYFENMSLVKARTYEKGMLKLFSQIVSEVNSRFELNHDITDGENILRNGVKVYGRQQDLTFLEVIKQNYIDSFMNDIKLDFPLKSMDYILLVGGGSEALKRNLTEMIPNAEITPQSQLSNAICYEQIGRVRFNG